MIPFIKSKNKSPLDFSKKAGVTKIWYILTALGKDIVLKSNI